MKRVFVLCLLLSACATAGSPAHVFDRYLQAYSAGDGQQMWALSSPAVHQETQALQAQFLKVLRNPDPAERVPVEGTFGVTAETIEKMETRTFFVWVIQAIRRQLGAPTVERAVATMRRLYVESTGPNDAHIVYRGVDDREHRLHIRRVNNEWLVEDNPFFPKSQPEGQGQVSDDE